MLSARQLLLGALGAGVLIAGAATQVDAEAAAKQLRTAFGRGALRRDVAACEAALHGAEGVDDATMAEVVIDAWLQLEGEADGINGLRRESLLDKGGSRELGPLRHQLRPLRALQGKLLGLLRPMQSWPAVSVMMANLIRGRSMPWTLRVELAAHAVHARESDLAQLIAAAGKAKGVEAILLLLRAIAPIGRRGHDAGAWAVDMLQHKEPVVRLGAAATLGKLGWPGALRPLIERLGVERGELHEGLLDALVTLTGVNPGDSLASWQLWLEHEGGPYLAGRKPLGRGDPAVRQRQRQSGTSAGSYFGLEQDGDSILYVIDVSLSMRAKAGGGGATRWTRCRDELIAALERLQPKQRFGIVTFANHVRVFEPRMLPARERQVRRAIDWVRGLRLEFETNVYDALELAFLLGGRGVQDRYYEPEIDTIFFLTDGAPTIPLREPKSGNRIGQDRPAEILAEVRRWNALGRVTIHTIGLGLEPPAKGTGAGRQRARNFLKKLAAQNGGRFVLPK